MARRNKLTYSNVPNAAADSMATLRLDMGFLYHCVFLKYKRGAVRATRAQMITDIDAIRVIVNGKVQRDYTPAQLLGNITELNGYATRDGILPIFFGEPWRRLLRDEVALAWGTANIDSFYIEVDFSAAAVTPALSATAQVEPLAINLQAISKTYRESRSASGAGVLSITDLPRLDNYQRVHFHSAAIDKVEVFRDRLKIYDRTRAEMLDDLAVRGFVPNVDGDVFHVIFDDDEQAGSVVSTRVALGNGASRPVNELRFALTMSGADADIPIVIERLGNPD